MIEATIKAEGAFYTRVWDMLVKDRHAQFFCLDLGFPEGTAINFWRRRDGIKTVIHTRIVEIKDSTPTVKQYFVQETNEEHED